MSFLDSIRFQQREERIKQYIMPQRIVLTSGRIKSVKNLLKEKDLQIDLYEPSLTVLKNGKRPKAKAGLLLDFGFEFHGGVRILTSRIHGRGSAGATLPDAVIRISFGESVSEALSSLGERGACNDHSPRVFTVPVSTLSDLEFGQTGYRFVYLQLESLETELCIKNIVGTFVYHDLEYKGSFECSDPLINRIYDTAAYTCHLNMQNLLWDGIKRDRLVWVGDTHPEMLTIRALFGKSDILDKSIRFAKKHAPLPQFMNSMPSYSLWWLLILHDYYMATGDKKFLNENKKYALSLAEYMSGFINIDGTHNLPDYFLDWPTKDTPSAMPGVHGLFILAMQAAAEIALWCNSPAKAKSFSGYADLMSRVVPNHFGAKQSAAMQALAGLRDMNSTGKELSEGGACGMSTFMSYYILKVISENSMQSALNILREYFGGMLKMGATTFWEDFHVEWLENSAPIDAPVPENKTDIHGDFGDYCYKGFRHSLCHGWASGPVPFLAERVLGIQIAEPGCKKIIIKPDLGDLAFAKGSFPTPYGIFYVACTRNESGKISINYTAPDGIEIVTA